MSKKLTRQKFLKAAGVGIAWIVLSFSVKKRIVASKSSVRIPTHE